LCGARENCKLCLRFMDCLLGQARAGVQDVGQLADQVAKQEKNQEGDDPDSRELLVTVH
jgi:hypothetical protein